MEMTTSRVKPRPSTEVVYGSDDNQTVVVRDCMGGNAEERGDIWYCGPPTTPIATSDAFRNSGSSVAGPPVEGATVLGVAGGMLLELETFPMNHDCNQETISGSFLCKRRNPRFTHRYPSSVSPVFFDGLRV